MTPRAAFVLATALCLIVGGWGAALVVVACRVGARCGWWEVDADG